MSRDYVEYRGPLELVRMIERHAVRDARAAVVAEHAEALEAEMPHDLDLIERHRALGVEVVLAVADDLAAVAVTAQIGRDDGVVARELACDRGPRDAALGRAVKEQHGRPAAADDRVNDGAARAHFLRAKAGEELCVDGERLLLALRARRMSCSQRPAPGHQRRGAAQEVAPIDSIRGLMRLIVGLTHGRLRRDYAVIVARMPSCDLRPPIGLGPARPRRRSASSLRGPTSRR